MSAKNKIVQFPPRTETFKYRDAEVVLTFDPTKRNIKFTGTVLQEYSFSSTAKDFKGAKKEAKAFVDALLGDEE